MAVPSAAITGSTTATSIGERAQAVKKLDGCKCPRPYHHAGQPVSVVSALRLRNRGGNRRHPGASRSHSRTACAERLAWSRAYRFIQAPTTGFGESPRWQWSGMDCIFSIFQRRQDLSNPDLRHERSQESAVATDLGSLIRQQPGFPRANPVLADAAFALHPDD